VLTGEIWHETPRIYTLSARGASAREDAQQGHRVKEVFYHEAHEGSHEERRIARGAERLFNFFFVVFVSFVSFVVKFPFSYRDG